MLDLVKELLEPPKFILFSSSLWAEISSWFISVQKQLKKKKNLVTPWEQFYGWLESCITAACMPLGTRFKVDGFLKDTEWVPCDSCELYGPWISHHALNLSLQRIPSVCFFHCLMSRFPKHVCNDQIYAFMTEVWGNVAIPAWLNVVDCIVFTA